MFKWGPFILAAGLMLAVGALWPASDGWQAFIVNIADLDRLSAASVQGGSMAIVVLAVTLAMLGPLGDGGSFRSPFWLQMTTGNGR